jgi:nucleotide-binding universal stress UspA family protein
MAVLISRESRCTPNDLPVVAAVRDPAQDRSVLVNGAACAAELSGALVLAHGVALSFAERSVGLAEAVVRGRAALDAGVAVVRAEGLDISVSTRLLRAYPHELVSEGLEASLLVVGGSPVGTPHRGPGLVALSAIRRAPCPVLLVPRARAEARTPGRPL